jgi:hypothetical protein
LVPEKRKMQATFTLGQSLPPQLLHGSCQQLMSILQKARTHAILLLKTNGPKLLHGSLTAYIVTNHESRAFESTIESKDWEGECKKSEVQARRARR